MNSVSDVPVRVEAATLLSRTCIAVIAAVLMSSGASAHFQTLLPSADVPVEGGDVTLDLYFTHPMDQGPTMDMAKPRRVGVKRGQAITDLTPKLEERTVDGKRAWRITDTINEPGVSIYFVEPQPYWEPAERKFIIQYAKVIVDAYASGEGWDAMAGLPVEIQPLTRPTGLWTGNIFSGVVRKDGMPLPGAEVEVEFMNDGSVEAPNPAFVTQVVKADSNGVFSYAMPRAGWWGFAALTEGDQPMEGPDGKPAPVEVGGVLWVQATDMK